MVLRLIRDLPGEPSRLPPSSPRCAGHRRQLGAKDLGRQDHTISPSASLPLVNWHACVHRIPASRVVTFAIRPSEERGGITRVNADFRKYASGIFSRTSLEPINMLDSIGQISCSAHLPRPSKSPARCPESGKANRSCLFGQITRTLVPHPPRSWRMRVLVQPRRPNQISLILWPVSGSNWSSAPISHSTCCGTAAARLRRFRDSMPIYCSGSGTSPNTSIRRKRSHMSFMSSLSLPAEIGLMHIAPIGQTPVAFALIVREAGVDIVEAPIHHLGRFDHSTSLATTIAHDPALTGCRGVWLVLRAAGCGLDARDHELDQSIGERGIVAERETAKVRVPCGDRLGQGACWALQSTTVRRQMGTAYLDVCGAQVLHGGRAAHQRTGTSH